MIHLYSSLSRKKEPLPDQKKIRLFVCGPTVYDYAHIGHARTYIFFDFFAKYLRSQGYDADYLQNITDIDDKIIKRAAENNEKPEWLAKKFTEVYFEDMKALGVDAVNRYVPATDFITQIVAQVERLIEKGFAYKIDGDGWYFDISKDKDYGKLSGRTAEQAEDSVSRIDESVGKKNKGDFCLWKFSKPGEPSWNTRLGIGRPGWHIEDTAITEYYFGPQYDIHGGGVDLKFPHHEAEIAQQESASGLKPFVKIWMHTGALLVDGKKMSKSLGNFITVREFLKKYPKHPAAILRLIVLKHHYRSPLDYVENETVKQAENELKYIYNAIYDYTKQHYLLKHSPLPSQKETLEVASTEDPKGYENDFFAALNDDLNVSEAFAILHKMLDTAHLRIKEKVKLLEKWDLFLNLGLNDAKYDPEKEMIIEEKMKKYAELRDNKQFTQSDVLRKEIEALNFSIQDKENGPYVTKKFF
jgi:cysteinyl-tRNA synthetase